MENTRKDILTPPNILTFGRIAVIPLIIVLVYIDGKWTCFLGALIYTLAAFSDLLDGYLARKLDTVTSLGKLSDPLADKLLVTCALILLVSMGRLYFWIAMIIICREIAVTALRGIASAEGIVIAASKWGKYKTVFQNIALGFLLLHYQYIGINAHPIGVVFIWVALFYTVWSGYDYFKNYLNIVFVDNEE